MSSTCLVFNACEVWTVSLKKNFFVSLCEDQDKKMSNELKVLWPYCLNIYERVVNDFVMWLWCNHTESIYQNNTIILHVIVYYWWDSVVLVFYSWLVRRKCNLHSLSRGFVSVSTRCMRYWAKAVLNITWKLTAYESIYPLKIKHY